ncbi:hypothetical protein [Enterococcus caccae]|uniref:Uncharacterized protein n=1 Tax=Enterococcus caccae ATCC BAA-1240 TaxID=1158612 RepID=R3X5L5_9ENTE|nr:hypothetical protein [Enterococcus caccae]EOL49340.1 hypothetical protein UC7_00717 [Enterococcus caccae ATCC BAA-1240]EOT56392.1 hypothetical protein I580_03192 [Enterococcus caccae ATCC BAA-1240]OJG24271.1 hypothetical protein RU98_GL001694 [Enterococcus caccae]
MPKPLLNRTNESQFDSVFSANTKSNSMAISGDAQIEKVLRRMRSKEYLDNFSHLDSGEATIAQNKVDDILGAIAKEFPEVELSGLLLGYASKCYLGAPYEVHTVDLSGRIIEHYKQGETLPSGMEKARAIAMNPAYAFIEVYSDCCRAVSDNGLVSVVKG